MNHSFLSADDAAPATTSRRDVLRGLAALGAAGLASPGHAQASYPSRPVKFVVGYPAGGSVDLIGRVIADALAPRFKATALVENQGGAAGAIAAQRVATSAPDGYTLLVGSSNELVGTRVINPAQRYDGLKDFTPIGLMATAPLVFAAAPHTGVKSLAEWRELLRRNPGKYSYGSSGVGSTLHFAGELFKQKAGVFMTHIPYRGGGTAHQRPGRWQPRLCRALAHRGHAFRAQWPHYRPGREQHPAPVHIARSARTGRVRPA